MDTGHDASSVTPADRLDCDLVELAAVQSVRHVNIVQLEHKVYERFVAECAKVPS
mgnify:CR=1 FL=1